MSKISKVVLISSEAFCAGVLICTQFYHVIVDKRRKKKEKIEYKKCEEHELKYKIDDIRDRVLAEEIKINKLAYKMDEIIDEMNILIANELAVKMDEIINEMDEIIDEMNNLMANELAVKMDEIIAKMNEIIDGIKIDALEDEIKINELVAKMNEIIAKMNKIIAKIIAKTNEFND